jgi:hypothetical protein
MGRGKTGKRYKRVQQLDMKPFDAAEFVKLKVTCACGAHGSVAVLSHVYYAPGFKLGPYQCAKCA